MSEMQRQEIFAAGEWNGIAFSEADLDAMVTSFEALGLAGRVPLKFGHDSPKPDGQPALGWVSRVWREGSKLLADFSSVPDRVLGLIRDKAYKFVSVELLKNVRAGTRNIPWVLDAVALLGADQPAVGILKELTMSARAGLRFDARVAFTRGIAIEEKQAMTDAEIAELRARLAAAEAEALKFKNESETFKANAEKERRTSHINGLKALVEDAITAFKADPNARELFKDRFGDTEDDLMRATKEKVTAWLSTLPEPKAKPGGKKFTKQEKATEMSVQADTVGEAVSVIRHQVERDHGYTAADRLDPAKEHLVFSRIKKQYPDLYRAYVVDPTAEFKPEMINGEAA